MKVTYNSDEDTLRILFCNAPIQESEAHRAGLILDYDQQGRLVGLELAAASEHLSRPYQVELSEPLVVQTGATLLGHRPSQKEES